VVADGESGELREAAARCGFDSGWDLTNGGKTRYLINDIGRESMAGPWILRPDVVGSEGRVHGSCSLARTPCLRCIFPEAPWFLEGSRKHCDTAGKFLARPQSVAAIDSGGDWRFDSWLVMKLKRGMIVFDLKSGPVSIALRRRPGGGMIVPGCGRGREFQFLDAKGREQGGEFVRGRNSVQIRPAAGSAFSRFKAKVKKKAGGGWNGGASNPFPAQMCS